MSVCVNILAADAAGFDEVIESPEPLRQMHHSDKVLL